MASNEVLNALHICHESGSTHLVQCIAVDIVIVFAHQLGVLCDMSMSTLLFSEEIMTLLWCF